jgi:hypothetical protein
MKNFLMLTIFLSIFATAVMARGQSGDKILTPDQAKLQRKVNREGAILTQLFLMQNDKALQHELEILDDQQQKLDQFIKDYQKNFAQTMKDFAAISQQFENDLRKGQKRDYAELTGRYYQMTNDLQTQVIADMNKVLLPHQMKRMRQIAIQRSFRTTKQADFLSIPLAMADELELSAKEIDDIRTLTAKVRKKYYEDEMKLRAKSLDKILSSLSAKQRKELKELIGDYYNQHRSYQGLVKPTSGPRGDNPKNKRDDRR